MTQRQQPPRATNTIPHGTLVRDLETNRVGILMDTNRRLAYLRPTGGGREWTTGLDRIKREPAP